VLTGRAQPNLTRTLGKLEVIGFVHLKNVDRRKVPTATVHSLRINIDPFSQNDRLEFACCCWLLYLAAVVKEYFTVDAGDNMVYLRVGNKFRQMDSIFQFRNESERRVLNLSKLTLFGFGLTHRCFFALPCQLDFSSPLFHCRRDVFKLFFSRVVQCQGSVIVAHFCRPRIQLFEGDFSFEVLAGIRY